MHKSQNVRKISKLDTGLINKLQGQSNKRIQEQSIKKWKTGSALE